MNLFDLSTPVTLASQTPLNQAETSVTPSASIKDMIRVDVLYNAWSWNFRGSKVRKGGVKGASCWVFYVGTHIDLEIQLGMILMVSVNLNPFSLERRHWGPNLMNRVNPVSRLLRKIWKVDLTVRSSGYVDLVSLWNILCKNSASLLLLSIRGFNPLQVFKIKSRGEVKGRLLLLLDRWNRSLSVLLVSQVQVSLHGSLSGLRVSGSHVIEGDSLHVLRQLLDLLLFSLVVKGVFWRWLGFLMLNDLFGFIDEAVELASASAQICVRVDSVKVGAFEIFV